MRGKSSSSSKSKYVGGGLEFHKPAEKLKEPPHLSGAYIRSLVKQLTSSKTKDSSNSNDNLQGTKKNTCDDKSQPPPPQHKKQVRRRLHTSRPYQERLLNMAEARREIVTALKYHRASMKQQASDKKQLESSSPHQVSLEQQQEAKTRRIYPSLNNSPNPNGFTTTNNYYENYSYSSSLGFSAPYSCWPVSTICPPPPFLHDNFNFPLPNQTLGLNLNLRDFTNLDTSSFQLCNNPSSIYSFSSPSTTSSSEIPCLAGPAAEFEDSGLHAVMDDKEMAEIRTIGEQHQVEWDDTMNMMSSACWFKFLNSMEIESDDHHHHHDKVEEEEEDYCSVNSSPFDEVMEFPVWLSGNESLLHHINGYCSHDYLQDHALPCMDIEEIEGMDGEWLA